MKIETTFFRSKVAIRIFGLFVCCALLPIATLAVLSYSQVTRQLNEQTQKRLKQAAKDVGGGISERLYFLGSQMKETASKLSMESHPTPAQRGSGLLKEGFKGLVMVVDQHENVLLFGDIQHIPNLTPDQKQYIRSGGICVWSKHFTDFKTHIFMGVAVDPRSPGRGILLGEISPAYLWGPTGELPIPALTELCILDRWNRVIFSSLPAPAAFPEQVTVQMSRSMQGQFEWEHEEKEYMASYRTLSLPADISMPKWAVVLSESKSDLLAPAAHFKKIFPLVILLSVWVVLLLSMVQIRRSLIPLEKLREGTRRIAAQDFNSPVTIRSGDEFEELGASFNTMASRLGKQFSTLTTMGKIDRAILSALETEKIIGVVLTHIPDVFPCNHVSVTLLDDDGRVTGRRYTENGTADKETAVETIEFPANEIQELLKHPESVIIEAGETIPSYLVPIAQNGIKTFLVLPIILKKRLSGLMTLGWSFESKIHTQEDFGRARQLADQMGVALSNASLIRELNEFNWGTLEALARAIDAKSHWTAGHSERVTKLALKIGRILGLPQEEIDVLHRAGLLHDIGKLGIPIDILDKEGKLSKKEEQLMREHVRLGLRILEPIAAYHEVMSVISHHHENFNGEGYPDGLVGKDISLGGRIFAVADSFDALTSNRPYRQALDREYATEMIKQGSGSRYDPDIVQAFLQVIAQEGQGEE